MSGGSDCQEYHLGIIDELCQVLDKSTVNVTVAIKVAEENMVDAIAARELLLKQADDSLATLQTLHEDLKKTVAVNIDLAHKNASLEMELNRARRETLVLRAEALTEKNAEMNSIIQRAKANGDME